jgi:hypothetical protein
MVPPNESFEADNGPINKCLGLIEKLKFAFCEGRREIVLNLSPFAQLSIHFRFEKSIGAGTFCLSAIKGRIGVADQLLTFGGIAWVDRDPYSSTLWSC